MKKYDFSLHEWNKGEHHVAGTTTNPARTVVSTWKKWHSDFDLKINKHRLLRIDGQSGFYQENGDRISKDLMIDRLMKWSSF